MAKFTNAFNCKRCPENNGVNGCPMWWEEPLEDANNPANVTVMKGCGYQMLPVMLRLVAKAAWTQAETVQSMRSEVNERVGRATAAVMLEAKRQAELTED